MTFEWKIQKILRQKDNDFITKIHWLRQGKSEYNTVNSIGILTYDQNDFDKDIIPFEEITKEVVEHWLETQLDVESIDNSITSRLNDLDQLISEIPWSEEEDTATDGE